MLGHLEPCLHTPRAIFCPRSCGAPAWQGAASTLQCGRMDEEYTLEPKWLRRLEVWEFRGRLSLRVCFQPGASCCRTRLRCHCPVVGLVMATRGQFHQCHEQWCSAPALAMQRWDLSCASNPRTASPAACQHDVRYSRYSRPPFNKARNPALRPPGALGSPPLAQPELKSSR